MCGILGVQLLNGERVDRTLLNTMIGQLHHRGPDATGFYIDGPVGFAHARLSIIDLSGGHQPMHNEDQTVWITFNGEIFNYIELRNDLIQKGHRFRTQSDTEVIIHLYEEKGEDCVQYLNGQWAFAIWDKKRDKLFMSRDRLGVRPLFYSLTTGMLLFGSEIKALLAYPGLTREIDLQALDQLFTFWVTLPPRTIFKGISELPPGHSLVSERGQVTIRSYWNIDYNSSHDSMSEQEAAATLLELLTDATKIRLRSDVPVGAYLSGGLDSTVITALIKKVSVSRLKTFSISFEDKEFDESWFQQEASGFLQTDHHEVRCSAQDIGRVFPDVIWHTEKPILRTAPAPLFLLSKLVREQGYKVVLTGEGSDEMLGGYDIFKEAKIRKFWGAFPESKIRPLLLKRLYPYLENIQAQSPAYLKAFFHVRREDQLSPFFSHLPRWELTSKLKMFFSEDVKSELKGSDVYNDLRERLPSNYSKWDGFSQAQFLETMYLLPGYILSSQGDRMAMAHSVEGRFPFLDHRVVEFASSIPPALKMKVLNEKYILKQAVGDLVPVSIKKRPKQPYRAPEIKSFIGEDTNVVRHEYVEELLSTDRIQKDGIFNPGTVQKLIEKSRKGRAIGIKDNMAFVGILSTQLIVDQFVNRPIGGRQNGTAV
ncbi:MAG: asparagine synthase (glutamine-hydrolyzing) [Nitrospirota bacterium]